MHLIALVFDSKSRSNWKMYWWSYHLYLWSVCSYLREKQSLVVKELLEN